MFILKRWLNNFPLICLHITKMHDTFLPHNQYTLTIELEGFYLQVFVEIVGSIYFLRLKFYAPFKSSF